jgi:hypothetical protein
MLRSQSVFKPVLGQAVLEICRNGPSVRKVGELIGTLVASIGRRHDGLEYP